MSKVEATVPKNNIVEIKTGETNLLQILNLNRWTINSAPDIQNAGNIKAK